MSTTGHAACAARQRQGTGQTSSEGASGSAHVHAIAYDDASGLRVVVAGPTVVLGARRLAWSRELATTSLVARPACPRLGDCSGPSHSRARGLLVYPSDLEAVMTPRRQNNGRVVPPAEPLRVANPHAAGIDVHAQVHWVAVP